MAAPSRRTAKPDGPFAYTNIHDAINMQGNLKRCVYLDRVN